VAAGGPAQEIEPAMRFEQMAHPEVLRADYESRLRNGARAQRIAEARTQAPAKAKAQPERRFFLSRFLFSRPSEA
jgi:hypothetical protein